MKDIIAFVLRLWVCLLFTVFVLGCSDRSLQMKADRVLVDSTEGQKRLWIVCDFEDSGTGTYLSAVIYHNASEAIRLAEKNAIGGQSIVFFVRGGSDPGPSGDSYTTSVEELRRFQKMNFEEFDKFASKSLLWSVMLKLPKENAVGSVTGATR